MLRRVLAGTRPERVAVSECSSCPQLQRLREVLGWKQALRDVLGRFLNDECWADVSAEIRGMELALQIMEGKE